MLSLTHRNTHTHFHTHTHTHMNTHTQCTQAIAFSNTLRLRRPTLGEDCVDAPRGNADYRLIATVSHHGKHAAGGHYTADVQQAEGCWCVWFAVLLFCVCACVDVCVRVCACALFIACGVCVRVWGVG